MTRDKSIDLLKGIGILFVVAGHAGATAGVFGYIYSFHMPLFAFVGGLFLRTDTSLLRFAKNKADRLLVPFFIWSMVCWVVYGLLIYLTRSEMLGQHVRHLFYIAIGSGQNSITDLANVTLWFLPFLFVSALIHYGVSRIKNRVIRLVVVLLISLLGVGAALVGKPLPYSLDTAFTLYPFIWLGSIYFSVISPRLSGLNWVQAGGLIAVLLVIHISAFWWEYVINGVVVDTASNNIGNYFLFYIGAFAAIGYWSVLVNKIREVRPLNYIGRNAIVVLIFHYPIIQLMRLTFMPYLSVLKNYDLYGWVQTALCLLICVPICYLVNRYLGWSIGQSNVFGRVK